MVELELLDSLTAAEKRKIKNAVEKELEKYRIYKLNAFLPKEAAITMNYTPRYHNQTNSISDRTASAAIYNADEQQKQLLFCQNIENAVNQLPQKEQFLIKERYLDRESQYTTDYSMYCFRFDPPISERTYAKIRLRAMVNMVLLLGIDCGVDLYERL